MKKELFEEYVSFPLVCIMVMSYYVVSLIYIKKFCDDFGQGPVFERSKYIFLLSNIANCIETFFNIFTGFIYVSYGNKLNQYELITIVPAIYFTRLYAACMALRVYRIILLANFRSGEVSEAIFLTRSGKEFIIIVANIYSVLSTIPFVCLVAEETTQENLDIYNVISYGFETLLFMFMSYKVFVKSSHPTIVVEYMFYAIIWSTGTQNIGPEYGNRWKYEVPMRNLSLLLVTLLSVYEHAKLIRPPLPSTLEITHIFEIEELYYSFLKFLKEKTDMNQDIIEACKLYLEYSKSEYIENFEMFEVAFSQSKFSGLFYGSFSADKFELIKESLRDLLQESVNEYFMSEQCVKFSKEYPIAFN